jgi:hypothetical protein
VVDPIPTTARRTVSLGPGDRDDRSAPIKLGGIPSASPPAIELVKKSLRVIGFM